MLIVEGEDFADRVLAPEISPGRVLGHDHGIRVVERGGRSASGSREGKHLEKRRIDGIDVVFIKRVVFISDQDLLDMLESRGLHDLRDFGLESRPEGRRGNDRVQDFIFHMAICFDPVQGRQIFVKPVETQLVGHPKEDQDRASQPRSQAQNIDEGVDLLSFHAPYGNFQIAPEHDGTPINGIEQESREGLEELPPIPQIRPARSFVFKNVRIELFEIAENEALVTFSEESAEKPLCDRRRSLVHCSS
jgi:hypothetical protein